MAGAISGCSGGGAGAQAEGESILELFAGPTPQEAAVWAIDPYDSDKRARGLLILANEPFGGERVYVEVYEEALKDSDPAVQAVAVRALALHGGPEHALMIAPFLESQDRLLRWEATRALQRLHNVEVMPALIGRLDPKRETESEIRAAAATALGQYAENRSLEALISALDDRDLLVNRAAQQSLKTLTGEDFRYDVRRWVAWRKETGEPFAHRSEYQYPVFYRAPTWVEFIMPWWRPPNEVASAPVGMNAQPQPAPGEQSSATEGEPIRN